MIRPMPFAFAAALALTACTAPFHLYPVKGPLAGQQPVPVILAKATGVTSGTISFLLPTGESCAGAWAPVAPGQVVNDLAPAWDSVFGEGNYVARVLGAKWHGRATIRGDQGTVVLIEFYRDTVQDSPLLGIAKDNNGNIYKVAQ